MDVKWSERIFIEGSRKVKVEEPIGSGVI